MTEATSGKQKHDFPTMIVRAIEALSDKNRRMILINLNDRGAIAYSELQAATSLEKGTLNHHLEKLMAGALIRNFRGDSPANHYSSFYELSTIGRKMVDTIFASFGPSEQMQAIAGSASQLASYTIHKSFAFSSSVDGTTQVPFPLAATNQGLAHWNGG
jgi:DNA-binding transcriptional ArsR family regulator